MDKKKLKTQIIGISIILVIGLIFAYFMIKQSHERLINAPKIRKEYKLEDLQVNKIGFDRNGLYLNGKQYNSGGISSYSKVHSQDSTTTLVDIKPPFLLRKEVNNDTLEIIKEDRKLYLLVSEEMRWD